MLHILLLILKIIGIILLVILGILVLGVVCMLFVPVRYQMEAERKEGGGEPPVVLRVKVTWFLHLVNILFRFDGSPFLRVLLTFIPLFRIPKPESRGRRGRKGKEGKRGRKKKNGDSQEAKENDSSDHTVTGEQTVGQSLPEGGKPPDVSTGDSAQNDNVLEAQAPEEGSDGDHPSLLRKLRAIPGKIREIFKKIKSFFANIRYTIRKFCDKIKSASETAAYYREILEGEPFRNSFSLCKGELAAIAKSLKPDRFEARMVVGLEDPAATGQVLAVCGMLYPLLGGHLDVAGDFEKKRLEGHVSLKGKVRVFTFLRTAVKVYFSKDIRKLVKLFKKEAA